MNATVKLPDAVTDERRLAVLATYDILDTMPERGFDDVVQLATQVCEVPVALVSLVAGNRQWFKARIGFAPCQTDLSSSVCAHALVVPDLLVIPDLTQDSRTAANPLVTGPPGIRFYAGAPLRTSAGDVLGSLCVIDVEPRPEGMDERQSEVLRNLARQVMSQLELRRALAERVLVEGRLAASEAHWRGLFERLSEGFLVGEVIRDASGRVVDWRHLDINAAWGSLLGMDVVAARGRTIRELFPAIEEAWVSEFADVVDSGEPIAFTREVATLDRWYEGRGFALGQDRFGAIFQEVTDRIHTDRRRAALLMLGDRLRDVAEVAEVARVASEIVGTALGASRAAYGRLVDDEFVEIEPDWTAPGVASIAGRHRVAEFGDILDELRRGEAVVVSDVTTDPRTAANPARLLEIGIAAAVNMPIRERGRTAAVLLLHDASPRAWTSEAVAFLRNVADRAESAVARLRAEADQRLLNQEISHRLKNTLAMVQAISAQTLKRVTEQEAVDSFQQRILALAAAHEVLLQQSWSAAPIRRVVRSVIETLAQPERVRVSGPEVELGSRATLSLSLLLHELTTNALKYGSLSAERGSVEIRWDLAGEDFTLRWRERGGPPPAETLGRGGFGSRLIGLGLMGTGGTTVRYTSTGLAAEFTAKLAEIQQS